MVRKIIQLREGSLKRKFGRPIIFKAGFCGLGALFAASLEAEAVESAIMGKMEAYAMSNE
jgi:hypothetical protein